MKQNKVRIYLFFSLFIMSTIPFFGAYWQINDILQSKISGHNLNTMNEALLDGQNAFKELSKINPQKIEVYHKKFQELEEIRVSHLENQLLSKHIEKSYFKYFIILFSMTLLLSLALAFWISLLVARSYERNFQELTVQKEKTLFLEGISRWQDVAKQLAHELKNPLQPIKTWVELLKSSYTSDSKNRDYESNLIEAYADINNEISNLKKIVNSFTEFSSMPNAEFSKTNFTEILKNFELHYKDIWEARFEFEHSLENIFILGDKNLLRQVLTNLINNAVEANPDVTIDLKISTQKNEDSLVIQVENTGKKIDLDIQEKIFQPYFSTKQKENNFGLGLSIVKKIILEHNGSIQLVDSEVGANFKITIPLLKDLNG